MRTRILKHDEWHRLPADAELSKILPFVEPDNVALVVVEDDAGEIVACLSAIQVTHLEGTWVSPKLRGNAGVMRSLLRQAIAVPRVRGEHWAFCGTVAEEGPVDGYIRRLGGHPLPGRFYTLPIGD